MIVSVKYPYEKDTHGKDKWVDLTWRRSCVYIIDSFITGDENINKNTL